MEYLKNKAMERINELCGTNYHDNAFSIRYGEKCEVRKITKVYSDEDFESANLELMYSTTNRTDKTFMELDKLINCLWQLEKYEYQLEETLKEYGVIK